MTKHLLIPMEFKASADDSGTFTGIANAVGVVDSYNDRTVAGFASRDLRERGPVRPLLWAHDTASPIGEVELAETRRGLEVVKGRIVLDVQRGREAYALLKQAPKALGGMSIGYVTRQERITRDGVRELLDLQIFEVSLVTMPANTASTIDPLKASELMTPFCSLTTQLRLETLTAALRRARKELR